MADLYRTVITFEVLHEGLIPEDWELGEIVRETLQGRYSGSWIAAERPVTQDQMVALLEAQGTDPSFLLGDDWEESTTNTNRTTKSGKDETDE
ncbi:MAG TPA: hypothetical protein EYF98_16360 [Planctomycetes bacterium]|nr:hypothetical protein [Planctomycetota bacterium]